MIRSRIVTICFAAIAMAAVSSAYGQAAGPEGGPPPVVAPPKANKAGPLVVEREVFEKLDLTATEKDQIKTAIVTLGNFLKDLRREEKAAPTPNPAAAKDKRNAIRKTYLDSLKGILTPDQFKQYIQLHREMTKKPAATATVASPAAAPPMPAKQG